MTTPNEQTMPVYAGWFGSWQISVRRRPLGVPELARRYDRLAPRWQRLTARLGLLPIYQGLFTRFIRDSGFMSANPTPRVLDCGIGAGDFSLGFARAWTRPVELHAVDVSAAMITHARQRLQQTGLDVRGKQADVCALPYPSNHFDLVMAAHVLEHLPDPVVALREMQRVTRPGGWVVACITRESILGRYIQLKWRTHRLNAERADAWLRAAGLIPQPVNFETSGSLRLTSLTCIGRKPHNQQETSA
ncbi:MAG: class I SAM-dependent methyltransferase [Gammaproteobacteria bacterium]|nr:class I SAM-dependent methyltransferase [Gammaproteobacteria bacterium]